MIQTLSDTGINIPHKYDGASYYVAMPCCVCGGVGDEFTLNYSASSLSVTFASGSQAVVGGQFFHITEAETLTLPSNSTGYICCEIDVSQTIGNTGKIVFLTSAEIKKENINGNGTIHDMPLYLVTTGASGIVSVADARILGGEPHLQVYMTQAEYDALPVKSEMVDYNIYED